MALASRRPLSFLCVVLHEPFEGLPNMAAIFPAQRSEREQDGSQGVFDDLTLAILHRYYFGGYQGQPCWVWETICNVMGQEERILEPALSRLTQN